MWLFPSRRPEIFKQYSKFEKIFQNIDKKKVYVVHDFATSFGS